MPGNYVEDIEVIQPSCEGDGIWNLWRLAPAEIVDDVMELLLEPAN